MKVINSNDKEEPLPYLKQFIKSEYPPKPDEIDWLLIMKWAMKKIKKELS